MWARVARFEGDPADVEDRISRLRTLLDGDELPPALVGAKVLMLVDRESGGMLGVTLFETEEQMRTADTAMNAGQGHAGSRSGVDFYEVPVHVL